MTVNSNYAYTIKSDPLDSQKGQLYTIDVTNPQLPVVESLLNISLVP